MTGKATSHKMSFTPEQKNNAYRELNEGVKALIMASETTDLIANSLSEARLDEDQANLADSEILYTMYGLQTLDVAIQKIAAISNKSVNELKSLRAKLEENLFNRLNELGKVTENQENSTNDAEMSEGPVIITQETKEDAMRRLSERMGTLKEDSVTTPSKNLPMVEDGEVAHEVPHVESTMNNEQLTRNAKVEAQKSKVPVPDYRYPGGTDPYREPLG